VGVSPCKTKHPAPARPNATKYYDKLNVGSARVQQGGFVVSLAVAGGAALLTFVFLCVTGHAWLSIKLGPIFAGLAVAGLFLLIAVIGAAASAESPVFAWTQRTILFCRFLSI
jgi:hypothetical protein